jgi:glutaredoxin
MTRQRRAVLYRMVLPDHECPYGLKAKALLENAGYEIEEHILKSREEVDSYLEREGVSTTPQTFIDGERVGDSYELERYLNALATD